MTTPLQILAAGGSSRLEECTGEVRWHNGVVMTTRDGLPELVPVKSLQQRWRIRQLDAHGKVQSLSEEWRNVPEIFEP